CRNFFDRFYCFFCIWICFECFYIFFCLILHSKQCVLNFFSVFFILEHHCCCNCSTCNSNCPYYSGSKHTHCIFFIPLLSLMRYFHRKIETMRVTITIRTTMPGRPPIARIPSTERIQKTRSTEATI